MSLGWVIALVWIAGIVGFVSGFFLCALLSVGADAERREQAQANEEFQP